jgi:MYXO-CTERM domain-containing protein
MFEMTRWIADESPCLHGLLRARWLPRLLLILAVSTPPWWAHAQHKGASSPENNAGATQGEWERLLAESHQLYEEGRYGEAILLGERAVLLVEKALGPHHRALSTSLNNLAEIYREQGQYEKAEPLHRRALGILENALGPHDPDVAVSLINLAEVHKKQGRFGEAEPLLQRVVDIFEKTMGSHHPNVAMSLSMLAEVYRAQGRFGEAEPLLQRELGILEKELGAHHPYVARSLEDLAALYLEQGRHEKAEPLYVRALDILEQALGPHHWDVATSLSNLAELYREQGRYEKAEPLHRRALGILEKALGPHHQDVAMSLSRLAAVYQAQGRYGEAEPLFQRALAIFEKTLGGHHSYVARILNNLAEVYRAQGRYGEAEPLYVRALGIQEKALGKQHPDVAVILNNLAVVYWRQGRYEKAEPLLQHALGIQKQALRGQHPQMATNLNNLAGLYAEQGRYGEAESLYVRALKILEKMLGAHDPHVATSLTSLAGVYSAQGRYGEAEPLLQRAVDIHDKALGEQHPQVAGSLNNLAVLYRKQGRYGEAEPLFVRALEIHEKTLGEHHPHVATSLNHLAGLYETLGRYREAEALYVRALGVHEKALGEQHPAVAQSLNNLAGLYRVQGRYREAESLYVRALGIVEQALGEYHPHVATSLDNLAELYAEQGRHGEAEPLLQRALVIREKALGGQHPDVAASLRHLAALYLAQKNMDRAIAHAERAERASDEHLSEMMRHGSEQQKHAFMAINISEVDIGVMLALRAPGDARAQSLAMRHLLRRKGRVLDAMRATLEVVRDNLDEGGQALLDQYRSIRAEHATQYLRGPQSIEPEQHRTNLAELEKKKREIEVRLSEKSSQFGEVNRPVTLGDVQNAVPNDAALIEWIFYLPFNENAREPKDRWQSPRYAACVLTRRGAPTCLDLGDAKAIDAAALALHRTVALGLESRAPARALEALIMAPVRRVLGSARKLYLSPDGALQFIPFAALVHHDGNGPERYLVEQFELVYVTGGRDLVRVPRTAVSWGPVTVLGDPRYSVPGTSSIYRFPRLPGTHQEVDGIGALFAGARVLTDADASESAVKNARAPWILHLATHAYFGAQDCTGQPQTTDNPLLAAGLALAGANACQDGSGGDGVLTGEELAGLDLYGTQLVVLSACDTGIGELALRDQKRLIGVRDGVYGLRRALMLAGTETQVVSLWKVNDLATQELMAAYYRALLQGLGRAEALRQVQLAMLRSKERPHPYYWASFAVVGMDGPLRLPPGQAHPGTTSRGPRGCACDVGAGRSVPGWAPLVLVLAVLVGLRRRPRSGLLAALMLLAALLTACEVGRRPGAPTAPLSDEAATGRALDWTIGPTRAPPSRGRARLLWLTAEQPLNSGRPVTTCEESATSLLPAPDGSRVYLAANGAIFFVPSSGAAPAPARAPTPLTMSPPGVHVRRLLAFVRERQPPVLLAQVEEGVTARETLWLFRIQGQAAVGKRVESYADFVDAAAFYRRFDNPRCDENLRDCIVVSAYGGDTTVSIEPEHGSLPRTEIEDLRGAGVGDMAWVRGASPRAHWILHQCDG